MLSATQQPRKIAAQTLSPSAQATLEKHLPGLPSKRIIKQFIKQTCDVGCVTDLCSSEQLPEVEIFSLLEEQIPKYRIRADCITQFVGYENQDFAIQFPALPIPVDGLGLTKDQTRECLNYFLLCGNRVSQMTRTYDDIQAVTRLLEEKEKDLELTVQIGKELLTQNNRLENKILELEGDIKIATESIAQFSHELNQKNELIGILTNDVDYGGSENVTPTASKSINFELLQRKVATLETENKNLKSEVAQVVKETDEVEEHERRLMEDITNQLNSTNMQYDGVSLELERYKEENRFQHEQIINLTSRLAEVEMRLHQLTTENEETSSRLCITKETQNMLATELAEFKVRYQEVLSLLQESQEQLRRQRKRVQPIVRSSLIPGLTNSIVHPDSLQSELMETSLYSDNSLDSGILSDGSIGTGVQKQNSGYEKIFETVRYASNSNKANNLNVDGISQLGSMSLSTSSQPRMSSFVYPGSTSNISTTSSAATSSAMYNKSGANSIYSTLYGSSIIGNKSQSRESLISDTSDNYPRQSQTGIPGCPGAKDLEAALNRLTPAEVLSRRAMLSHAPIGTYSYDDAPAGMPLGIRTPDSIMSTGSSGLTGLSSQWRLPEKLRIVKPLEGSQTLHHWARLATPNMSGLLDDRPGVTIRGGRDLDELGLQLYSLSDVEEDADDNPGKHFDSSACVYTYTNSTVMHPDDGTSITFSLPPSQMSSQMHSECPSQQPSAPPTPRAGMSRRNSCSTFSVHMGLASVLNERGIKAVTPSALNTPSGHNFSPTVTPCNSPDGSPSRSSSPESNCHQSFADILTTGADMLRKKITGLDSSQQMQQRQSRATTKVNKIAISHLERKTLKNIRILEKVESLGLESLVSGSGISPLALHSSNIYTARRTSSPMAQLTNFKHLSGENRKRPDNDAEVKAAINKGFSNDSLSSISTTSSTINSCGSSSDISSSSNRNESNNTTRQSQISEERRQSLAESRVKHMQRQKSRRSLVGSGGQRPDLGTVGNNQRPMGSTVGQKTKNPIEPTKKCEEQRSLGQSFVGSISSLLFGRKGGLL